MSFKESIERIEDSPGSSQNITVWVRSYGYCIKKDDLDAFCSHMDDWYSVANKCFSRTEYEEACARLDIEVLPDDQIGGYGCKYGDYGMGHYHTDPAHRKSGITGSLLQSRWFGMLKEIPDLEEQRKKAEDDRIEALRLKKLRATYPVDLMAWIEAVGGLETIYQGALKIHQNNSTQLREEGRHFEWLIGHTCSHLGFDASCRHPDYIAPIGALGQGVYPLHPAWWAGWREVDEQHPINRIASLLSDRRIEPYHGKVTYIGYGEDCGDDVRKNLEQWCGSDL